MPDIFLSLDSGGEGFPIITTWDNVPYGTPKPFEQASGSLVRKYTVEQ